MSFLLLIFLASNQNTAQHLDSVMSIIQTAMTQQDSIDTALLMSQYYENKGETDIDSIMLDTQL